MLDCSVLKKKVGFGCWVHASHQVPKNEPALVSLLHLLAGSHGKHGLNSNMDEFQNPGEGPWSVLLAVGKISER